MAVRKFLGMMFAAALTASGAVCGAGNEATVFAAASTTDAVQELGREFAAATGSKVKFNLGSSGTLVRQLEQKAPGDIFISASKKWADYALEKGLLDKSTVKNFLTNGLVVVAPLDSPIKPFKIERGLDFPALFKGRLSIGNPAHVPAGKYAAAALKHFGWDKPLAGRLLPAMDVRAALLTVEMGEAELGIVYTTDAAKSKKVRIVATFPVGSYPKILYVSGMCPGASPTAKKFYDFMLGAKGQAVFRKYGFIPLSK